MSQKVLLVDDSRAMRILLGSQVRALGFEVVEAADGGEALALLTDVPEFHFVLVDWNMPVLNGLDFIRAVRARRQYHNVRLIVVTSETEAGQMTAALEAGADEYLMKPFSREALASKLDLLGLLPEAT